MGREGLLGPQTGDLETRLCASQERQGEPDRPQPRAPAVQDGVKTDHRKDHRKDDAKHPTQPCSAVIELKYPKKRLITLSIFLIMISPPVRDTQLNY